MWMLKWIGIALLLILLFGFAMLNVSETVRVDLLLWQFDDMPLSLVIFESFIAGMLIWFLIAFVNELKLRNELRTVRRNHDELTRELQALRNQPLEEYDVDSEAANEVDEHDHR